MGSLARETQWMDATAQADLVCLKQVTPRELVDAALERAEQLNPKVNALNYVWPDRARDHAQQLASTVDSAFRGVPFVLKDLNAALAGTPAACPSPNPRHGVRPGIPTTSTARLVDRAVEAPLRWRWASCRRHTRVTEVAPFAFPHPVVDSSV